MRFSSGILTGIMVGAAAGVMATPMMSGRTRRKIAKTSKRMMNSAGRTIEDITDMFSMTR